MIEPLTIEAVPGIVQVTPGLEEPAHTLLFRIGHHTGPYPPPQLFSEKAPILHRFELLQGIDENVQRIRGVIVELVQPVEDPLLSLLDHDQIAICAKSV